MKSLTTTLAIATLCAVSCTQPEYTSLDEMFSKERTLSVTEEVALKAPVTYIYGGAISGSHIILAGEINQSPFVVVDLNTGEIEGTFLPNGRGRNEALYARFLSLQQDSVVCYASMDKGIRKSAVSELLKPVPDQTWSNLKNEWEGHGLYKSAFGSLSGNRYIFCGCREEGLFEIVDSQFNTLYTFGEHLPLEGADETERVTPYMGKFSITPSQQRLLYSTDLGNIYYFYDISDVDSEPQLLNKYEFELPKYNIKRHNNGQAIGIGGDDDTTRGTRSVAVSDNYFYLLNSDKKISDEIKDTATVLVFDRNGKPIERLTLEHSTTEIFYNEANNSLYTIGLNDREEDCLIRYKL